MSTLHNPRSCPHWRSTQHSFLCPFDSLSITRSWAHHVAYSSIMPTLDINTSLPSLNRLSYYYLIMSMSHCILLDHARIGDQHIPSFIDSFCLVLLKHQHSTLHTPRSGPQWRSTHPFLRRFVSLSTTRLWSRHVAYSPNHAHIGDQRIPSFIDLVRLVLQDDEHVMLYTPWPCPQWRSTHPTLRQFISLSIHDHEYVTLRTPRSCPHRRSPHPFLHRLDSLSTTRLWAHHVA
jgi:hypothetical protein